MKKRIINVVTVSASLIISGCAYAFVYTRFGIGIPCLFRKITGFLCPGCGVSRMFLSIINLDFRKAFEYNPVVLCLLPVGAVLLFNGIKRYIKTGFNIIPKIENIISWIILCILIIFGIVRNFV